MFQATRKTEKKPKRVTAIETLMEQVAQEKLRNMQKDKLILETTRELAKVKLDIIELKKGGNK